MKGILVFGVVLLAAVAAVFLLSNPSCSCRYGEPVAAAPAVPIPRLVETPGDYLDKVVRIEGSVVRQCPNCGCWFFLEEGGKEVRVEAGDLGEPLPYRPGRRAAVEGRLIRYGDGYEFVGSAVEFH